MDRGPRTKVTEGVFQSYLDFDGAVGAKDGQACVSDRWFAWLVSGGGGMEF